MLLDARTCDPDAALLNGLLAGDERAFAELVERHGSALLRHARTFVQSAALAEDVVQETWLAVITSVERFEGRAQLRTWLYAIVANRARTRAARERRSVPFSALAATERDDETRTREAERFAGPDRRPGRWATAPEPWPQERVEAQETLAVLRAAIDALPATQREVVRLRDVGGWDAAEVCEALSLSAGNQRVLLHRGRMKVRVALEAYVSGAAVDSIPTAQPRACNAARADGTQAAWPPPPHR